MKNKSKLIFFILFLLSIPVYSFSQDFKTVRPGVEYAELTREIDKLPVRMNLLRLDLTKIRLDVVHALDKAIGVETVSSMAKRHQAFAAINAGFFRLDKTELAGDPAGALQIDGKLLSESTSNRIALFISNGKRRTETAIARLQLTDYLKANSPGKPGLMINFSGIGRERKDDELVLYTPEFGSSTLTSDGGLEVVVNGKGKVLAIVEGKGNNAIPPGGAVISASGKMTSQLLMSIAVGDVVYVDEFSAGDGVSLTSIFKSAKVEDIVAGVPLLIKNGKIDITWEMEKSSKSFVETKHPRTAVAKLKSGKFLLMTVDGRSESSGGISLTDLAALLLEFGATDAMNLDGGGSTTMFMDGKIVNHPSDKEGERKVSDALLVIPRTKK
jgi:hypothetical protein